MRWRLAFVLVAFLVVACGALTPTSSPGPTFPPELVRRAAWAEQFYPNNPQDLTAMVDGFLANVTPTEGRPIALIVPHAGYPFSGQTAGYAFAELYGYNYDAVILIGQNHHLRDFAGIAVYPGGAFETPLGLVPVHAELAQAILQANPNFEDDPALHAAEHSLEVELPFLQRVLPGTPIVPILIGWDTEENAQALTEALNQVLPGKNVLLVASSDLSHYPPYEEAVRSDHNILSAIETMDVGRLRQTIDTEMSRGVPNLVTTCCGAQAIAVVMQVAPRLGANQVAVLHYANSGDVTGGDHSQVVGYGAVKFWSR